MKIALLTCERFPDLMESDKALIPEFKKHKIEAIPAIWNDEKVNWKQFDFLVFRSTWDYYELETEFNEWLDLIESLGVKTLNPLEVIKKNKHKFYLKELEQRGIKIIPTVFLEKTDNLSLESMIPDGWDRAVLKPAFSAGSYLTQVFSVDQAAEISQKYTPIAREKELLLQKFMPEIKEYGETSLIFFNKVFSHAINKKPKEDDFRVQIQYGGLYAAVNPSAEVIESATKIVESIQEPLLYARVDGIIIDNQLHLMEIELIEPDLYFGLVSGKIGHYVNAMVQMTRKQPV